MRRMARKYTAAQESEFRFRTLEILDASEEAVTIEDIQHQDMILQALTPQKMSRVLSDLIDVGLAHKAQSKELKRMVYKSDARMCEQGYEVRTSENMVG